MQDETCRILVAVKEYLERRRIPFSLAYGTLLGAARHGGFIPHDNDVDLFLSGRYAGVVEEMGTALGCLTKYTSGGDSVLQKLCPNGLREKTCHIDFFNERFPSFAKRNNYPPEAEHLALLEASVFRDSPMLVPLRFCGLDFPAPANYEVLLKRIYGDNCLTHVYPRWLANSSYQNQPESEFIPLDVFERNNSFVQPDLMKYVTVRP